MTTKTNLVQNSPVDNSGVITGVAVVKLTHVDLTTVGVAQTIAWATLAKAHPIGSNTVPAYALLGQAFIRRITDFSGGGAASVVITVGDAGDPDELLDDVDVFTGAKATAPVSFTTKGVYTLGAAIEAAYSCTITTTADVNVSTLDAGECEICIPYTALSADAALPA